MSLTFETERLILRKPKKSDYKDIYEGIKDKNISKHLLVVPHPYTEKDAKKFIAHCLKSWKKKKMEKYPFFIELKSENKVIGVLELMKVKRDQGTAETGSWLNKKYQRKGYMTEAKIAINNFAFKELGLRRMSTHAFTDNIASNKTQKKMGYIHEGTLRQVAICKATGKIHDEHTYSLLKEEWEKRLPKLKKELAEKIKETS
ncbi:MAG: GNAT family N-acetyltransferase [Nanobdellota archaeon]